MTYTDICKLRYHNQKYFVKIKNLEGNYILLTQFYDFHKETVLITKIECDMNIIDPIIDLDYEIITAAIIPIVDLTLYCIECSQIKMKEMSVDFPGIIINLI
jgi:hypothetical protein